MQELILNGTVFQTITKKLYSIIPINLALTDTYIASLISIINVTKTNLLTYKTVTKTSDYMEFSFSCEGSKECSIKLATYNVDSCDD